MRSGSRSGYAAEASATVSSPRPKGQSHSTAAGGATRIAALSALVEELSGQIDAIEGASRRDAIRRGVRQTAARVEPAPLATEPGPPVERGTERLTAIESRLAAMAEEIAQRERPVASPAPRGRDEINSLQAAIDDIAARQQTIDHMGSGSLPAIDTLALEDALRALRDDIGALDRRMAAEAHRKAEPGKAYRSGAGGRVDAALSDETALAALRGDLAEIKRAIDLAARETTLASIESGYGHMIERLDDIVRRVPDRERLDTIGDDIARLADRIEQAARPREVDGELEDIRNAIASIGARRSDDTLAHEVSALRQVVERLATTGPGSSHELARIEERLDALAGRFDGSGERRMADLSLAIEKLAARPLPAVDLSRIERDIGAMRRDIDGFAKGTDPVMLLRLEKQVKAIRTALDERLSAPSLKEIGALQRLEDRLDAIAGRLDAIADLPNLLMPASDEALAGLRAEIADLRSDVTSRQPARFDEIEVQMRSLVERVDEATNRDDGQALAQLEAQVGALAEKLAGFEPDGEAFAKVEDNLERLQSLLADARRDTIEAARATARTTVEEFAGSFAGGADDALVAALREDLHHLQDAAMRSDRHNQDTLDAVHDTLAKVIDRIAQLEAQENGGSPSASLKERLRGATAQRPFATSGQPEDHRPLAPGSGRPDLSAITVRPEDDVSTIAGDRKADFIAAARRAAQAAQAEAAKAQAEVIADDEAEQKQGPLARLGQAFRARRRPLVLAIAAVVLAIGAAKLGPAVQDRLAGALAPLTAPDKAGDLDSTVTGAITPPSARIAAPSPGLVAPKANNEAIAFSADPFTGFPATAQNAPKTGSEQAAVVEPPETRTLDYRRVEDAAAKGDAVAAFEMARHFAEPASGRPDIKTAAVWYERAANAGLALAQYRLGSLYERGEGVKLDTAAAQRWYEKASLQGNARATHNLAVLISEGANGKPDYKRATDLFLLAGAMGVADSQYNLGVLYARGLGVPVDLVQSYTWFALAAQQGDTDAGSRRDEVAKAMKADDLARARLAVQAFRATTLDAAANDEPTPDPAWYATASATSMSDAPLAARRFAG